MTSVLHIVVPTRNRSALIQKLLIELNRVCSDPRISATVVDDGSDVLHKKNLERLERDCRCIQFKYLSSSYGAPYARNIGAIGSGSKWVWFFDDDDYVTSTTILEVAHRLEVGFNDSNDLHFLCSEIYTDEVFSKRVVPIGIHLNSRLARWGQDVNTSCTIVSRALMEQISGWDESLVSGQDTDFLLRASLKTDALVHEDLIVRVNHHGQSRITKEPRQQFVGKMQFIRKNWRLLHWIRLVRYLLSIVIFYPYIRRLVKR